jgi:MerR family Zn(II)-responsive transcriptional regulator of zntA
VRIGELAEATDTTIKTLRFYEQAGLLPAPARTPGGYRDYDPETIGRLELIRRSRKAGLSLAQIRDLLDVLDLTDAGHAPCPHVRRLISARLADLDAQLASLLASRDALDELRNAIGVVPGR